MNGEASKPEIVRAVEGADISADALDRLSELRQARDLLCKLIASAVKECRDGAQRPHTEEVGGETRRGAAFGPITWERIGDALGITSDAARRQFGEEGAS